MKALERATRKPRKTFKFSDAGLKVGDIIQYANDSDVTAQVISERKVLFEGEETSLSRSALKLLHRDGYTWSTVNGWQFWTFANESIAERLERILSEAAASDGDD